VTGASFVSNANGRAFKKWLEIFAREPPSPANLSTCAEMSGTSAAVSGG
jgi:hypothetical protein